MVFFKYSFFLSLLLAHVVQFLESTRSHAHTRAHAHTLTLMHTLALTHTYSHTHTNAHVQKLTLYNYLCPLKSLCK